MFPMLADDELEELAADIKERGLLQPIVLDAEGRILDGRNRLAACGKAGVEPAFVTYADGDPDGYALAVNINRRHLKASARHLIAEMARRLAGTSKIASSKASGTDPMRFAEAGVVLDFAPDLVEKIFAGGMTLQQAAEIARPRKREATEIKAKMDRLRVDAFDLYELVQEGRQNIDEALAALKCREEKALAEAEAAKEKARADAEASASDEKRKAHERSIELADCIKRGEDSAVSIVSRFVGDVSQIICARFAIDEAVAVLGDENHPAAAHDEGSDETIARSSRAIAEGIRAMTMIREKSPKKTEQEPLGQAGAERVREEAQAE